MAEQKMSLMGVGGKIAAVFVIYLAVTAGISLWAAPLFQITAEYRGALTVAGIVIAIAGFALNLTAALQMMRAHRSGVLASGGWYAVFLHPMYTFQILITIPGVLLLFNSWLVLTAWPVVFAAFKKFAKEEERYLANQFGDEYRTYKEKVFCKFL